MAEQSRTIGNWLAPPRFIAFALIEAIATPAGATWLGWRQGVMLGFDLAAIVFLVSCVPLFRHGHAESMRQSSKRNDANRAGLLAISAGVMFVVLVTVASELVQKGAPKLADVALIVTSLALAWTFTNIIYALHYAHMFYTTNGDEDCGGLNFPKTDEPDYWDFFYFSFTLGMTFQTSDVEMERNAFRRITIFHSMAAFAFNIGILAFTINVLGGG